MTGEKKCLKTLSEYRERRCRCHVRWRTVPEVGAGNWEPEKARLERLNVGTASWLEEADRSRS